MARKKEWKADPEAFDRARSLLNDALKACAETVAPEARMEFMLLWSEAWAKTRRFRPGPRHLAVAVPKPSFMVGTNQSACE